MSGGYFDYQQYNIQFIIEQLEEFLQAPDHNYSEETLKQFKQGLEYLKLAWIFTQRICWLLSGDDGEETFHNHLSSKLIEYYQNKGKE